MHSGCGQQLTAVRQTFVLFVDLLKSPGCGLNSLSSFNWYCSSSAGRRVPDLTVDDARGHGSFDAQLITCGHFLEQRGFIGIAISRNFWCSGLVSN